MRTLNLILLPIIIIFFILVTDASSNSISRKLGDYSPQSSPAAAPLSSLGSGETALVDRLTDERCSISETRRCQNEIYNITACLCDSPAPKQLCLLVQNDGDGTLKVIVTISNIKATLPTIQILNHKAKKINILANVEGSSSIILNAGKGKCIILMEPKGKLYKQLSAYANHLTPVSGAYFLFLSALIVGGAWACCKLGKSERHVDGVQYQELEMGQPHSYSPNNVETAEGWEEGWDDKWEETITEKSRNGHLTRNVSANGDNSRTSDTDDWID